jgi:hypothetical protein
MKALTTAGVKRSRYMSRNQVNRPHGEQVIKIAMDDVRALGILPRDVEVMRAISSSEASLNNTWIPESQNFLYLHITSTISFDRPDNSPLCIETLFDFYARYISLRRDWASKLENDMAFFTQTGVIR